MASYTFICKDGNVEVPSDFFVTLSKEPSVGAIKALLNFFDEAKFIDYCLETPLEERNRVAMELSRVCDKYHMKIVFMSKPFYLNRFDIDDPNAIIILTEGEYDIEDMGCPTYIGHPRCDITSIVVKCNYAHRISYCTFASDNVHGAFFTNVIFTESVRLFGCHADKCSFAERPIVETFSTFTDCCVYFIKDDKLECEMVSGSFECCSLDEQN